MPAAAADESGPLRLLTTIYRQSWPPPAEGDGNESIDPSVDKRATRSCLWRGEERAGIGGNKISRPFSASLISPRREKKTTRLMSARRSNASKLSDVKGLNSSTFRKRTDAKGKIPEYDSSKVISDSAAARNRALAAEYIAMLSGRNYVKKQYREQYWQNEASMHQRPPSGRYIGERRHLTLYPDLGSVLGGQASYLAGTAAPTNSPPRSSGPWRLSTSSQALTGGKNHTTTSNGTGSEDFGTVPELGLAFRSKRSWSNIPTGKCYRVLSHPNDTLASLCLEGRSAASRASNSRTSSLSSTISMSGVMDGQYRLSSAGESSPSGSSDAISGQSRPCSGDESPEKASEFLGTDEERNEKGGDINSDNEFHGVHGLPDSVFTEDENIENRNDVEDVASEDETGNDDEFDENITTDGAGRLSFSDLEESDISENEADDYEEDDIDEDEVNRRLQQVSAVFDTTNDSNSLSEAIAIIPAQESDNESCYSEHSDKDDKEAEIPYQYTEFLPQPYKECDLRLFATLPVGMDWRAFVQPDSQHKKTGSTRGVQSKNDTEKRRFKRGVKEREAKRRSLENTIDRMIMLEKMQALTVQYEQDKRRHLIHRAKARNAQKAASNNTQPNVTPTQSTPTNNEVRPQSARGMRRRSSTVSAFPAAPLAFGKPRKSQSSAELRNDAILNKSSPDLDLVRSSCTKNHLQYARRLSYSNRRRHRFGATLPRYYEYSWSERLPPSKRLSLSSLLYTKPRNCQQCRESDRRWAHVHTNQILLGRPRSAFSTFASEQQKLHQRPSTVSTITKNPVDSAKENRSTSNNRSQVHQGSPSRAQSTFGRPPPKPTSRDAQEKIFAAKAMLSSVAKDYARAARKGGKHARRASSSNISTRSGRSSPSGVVRYRKDARVLKPNVIDCANLRLR